MAIELKSPGVYVVEVASGNAPIVGVGTSTAGFIGVIAAKGDGDNATLDPRTETIQLSPFSAKTGDQKFELPKPTLQPGETFSIVPGSIALTVGSGTTRRALEDALITENNKTFVKLKTALSSDDEVKGSFQVQITPPVAPAQTTLAKLDTSTLIAAGTVTLCTNFSEFKASFGDFSSNPGQRNLAHAVYGFFRNGGTRCFVVWVAKEEEIGKALEQFEAIDEIALVVAPGVKEKDSQSKIADHCAAMGDRFAILDGPEQATLSDPKLVETIKPFDSDFAALYFPWIKVFDPVTKANNSKGDGLLTVPPSGHIAGLYARVDTQRGVHKAPANEAVLGAMDVAYPISKAKQDGLNPAGINCIRNLNGNILVWGARTLGGDANGEFKYINVRRLFNYLRESIDEGTQWAVFEPNSPELWAKIRRNITAFLTTVWRSGALFGTTPEQAFYIKCDEETNPPENRENGVVITEIGVAVVKPAEFVVFRVSQWSGPGGS